MTLHPLSTVTMSFSLTVDCYTTLIFFSFRKQLHPRTSINNGFESQKLDPNSLFERTSHPKIILGWFFLVPSASMVISFIVDCFGPRVREIVFLGIAVHKIIEMS